ATRTAHPCCAPRGAGPRLAEVPPRRALRPAALPPFDRPLRPVVTWIPKGPGADPGRNGTGENVGMSRLGGAPRRLLTAGLLATWGCAPGPPATTAPPQPFRGLRIAVGAIGDAGVLPIVAAQRGEWSATRAAEV